MSSSLMVRRAASGSSYVSIDADGFIRYQHFGEGAYEENEAEIQEFLSERPDLELNGSTLDSVWMLSDPRLRAPDLLEVAH